MKDPVFWGGMVLVALVLGVIGGLIIAPSAPVAHVELVQGLQISQPYPDVIVGQAPVIEGPYVEVPPGSTGVLRAILVGTNHVVILAEVRVDASGRVVLRSPNWQKYGELPPRQQNERQRFEEMYLKAK